jgi:hypothetical protein
VRFSELFADFHKLKLTENMRVDRESVEFRQWLWDVGNGLNYIQGTNKIRIDEDMRVKDLDELIDFVFPPETLADPLGRECFYT